MILTAEQNSALDKIRAWMARRDNREFFYLAGYAGTGKTTLLQELINGMDKRPHCLAPTGKAASVLQRKLQNANVTTIHHALYKPMLPSLAELEALQSRLMVNPNERELHELIREAKKKLSERKLEFSDNLDKEIAPGDYVFVDEASMVTGKMFDDIQNTDAMCLYVGDPGQLPPVKERGFFTQQTPNALLTEVQRQALDNPIIRLSMDIREGNRIPMDIENEHIVRRPRTGFPIKDLLKEDQLLTGMNASRHRLNRACRRVLGIDKTAWPVTGEKLICLKNQYARGGWMVNGMGCLAASDLHYDKQTGEYILDVMYDDQLMYHLQIYPYPFEVHYNDKLVEEPWSTRSGLSEFDFGYAVTVHKAQGSEWNRVLLLDDELNVGQKEFRKQWLYTAVTRAREHLTWLTN
jgi:exodeoxyribonuclease-5